RLRLRSLLVRDVGGALGELCLLGERLRLRRERRPARLELEQHRFRRLAREPELAALRVVAVAVARDGRHGRVQELRALDDRELRDERARVADQNAQRAEPGLGRLLEEVESRPGGRRDEGRRALAERRGNGALVAGIDLEERQGQALAPLGERTGGRWNPLALGERALERREALLRGQCTLGERVAVVRSLARGGTGIESLLLELLRRRPRTCGVGLGLRELGAQPGDQPRRRLTLHREARGAASQLEGDGQRGLALAGGARQLFLDRRAA